MWDAWAIDRATVAFIVWWLWFAYWETWAITTHDYAGTWTAHLRPIFVSTPPTWWLGVGLYVWFGIHIFAPSLETTLSELVKSGVSP